SFPIDTKIPVNIKSSGYKTGDQASICINGKEYSLNKPGINIVVMDLLTFQVTERASFDTGHDKEASEQLIECIDMIPVGSLVFIAVRGEANYFLSDKAKICLKDVGLEECDFKTGELWSLCGYKNRDKGTAVAFLQGYDVAQLDTSLNLGCYTNEQVQGYILLPLIELLMSTPASLAISKVSELELLTVLARHDNHKEVMVNSDGFMDYIVELINNMSHKTADQLRANPLVIAHCIGAMKILTAISIAKESHEGFTQHNVVDTILALLSLINGIQLGGFKEGLLLSGAGQLQIDGVHDWQSDHGFSITDTFASPCENVSTIAEEVKLTASGLRSPLLDHTQDAATPLSTVQLKNSLTKKSSVKPRQPESVSGEAVVHDDLDEAFSNLTGLSMVTLYNCIDLISSSEESREHFLKAGAMQIVWCRLLTANASTLQQIALPTEMLDFCCYFCAKSGWQTEDCRYGPERGAGVGDDKNSCAFDGARCKIWSGPLGEQINNDYGKEWSSGDVLSCLFSWNGEVSYWLNGVDMGVAFRGLNTGVNWYPAASVAMDQTCSFNFGDKPFRYNIPEGYVAVSHIVSNLVKKNPLRLSSCWTPVSGSFESIVEEDEELNDDKDLETTNTEPGNRDASSSSKKVDILVLNEKPTQLTLEHGSSASEMFSDPRETSELCGSSLTQSFESASHSLTFGTPSCSILTETPRASPIKPQPSTLTYTPGSIEQTPLSAEGTGERIAPEEKSPCEEKHVTSTPYLEFDSMMTSKDLRDSRMGTRDGISQSDNTFMCELERVIPCLYFEAELKQAPCRVKQMGFINKETKEKIYCDIHDGHLQLPKTSSPSSCEQERVPDIVGCAVVLSTGQVMFTLDGVPTGQFYDFPTPIDRLSPYISCTRIRCNYGQRSFLFEDANAKESFSCSGSLLYNCLRSVNTVKKH
ncbi:PREDICTED: uncharacterized protein LOC107338925, partial [Acropora digitifera]|uniref:uncharacterized protein LOC107338925 n=1 Tax=Acropora digitifera TaxID=70779 RepID=UPI00077A1969